MRSYRGLPGRTDRGRSPAARCLAPAGPGRRPGPAGNLFAAWKRLAERSPAGGPDTFKSVVGSLGLRWSDDLAGLPEGLDDLTRSGRPAPIIAAALMTEAQRLRPDAELLGWWLAERIGSRA